MRVKCRIPQNQAAPQETFGFLGPLTNEYPAQQDEEHEVRIRELKKWKHGSAGDIWFSALYKNLETEITMASQNSASQKKKVKKD